MDSSDGDLIERGGHRRQPVRLHRGLRISIGLLAGVAMAADVTVLTMGAAHAATATASLASAELSRLGPTSLLGVLMVLTAIGMLALVLFSGRRRTR